MRRCSVAQVLLSAYREQAPNQRKGPTPEQSGILRQMFTSF